MADQAFVEQRPDVLTFVSAPLEHDITVTGPLAADLFASTSGTDSDFVVKLIIVLREIVRKIVKLPFVPGIIAINDGDSLLFGSSY